MTAKRHMPKWLLKLASLTLAAALAAYFGFYALSGDRGVAALARQRAERDAAATELAQVRTAREILEHRVSLLRPDSLDLDLLEERVRSLLHYGRPGEVAVPLSLSVADAPASRD